MSGIVEKLKQLAACEEAVVWAKGYKTFPAAWAACERGDWLAWWVGRQVEEMGGDLHRALVLAACEYARPALPHTSGGAARTAIETAESWARGEHNDVARVRDAADAADAAAAGDAADADCAGGAAADAAALTYAVGHADAYAGDAAAYAGDAIAYAVYATDGDIAYAVGHAATRAADARAQSLKGSAEIVRNHFVIDDKGRVAVREDDS